MLVAIYKKVDELKKELAGFQSKIQLECQKLEVLKTWKNRLLPKMKQ